MKFLVIDGRPCPASIAPYVYLVLRGAAQHASAIYRGDDPAAKAILHAHGGHTQRELANATPAQRRAWGIKGIPNRPGFSQHELRNQWGQPIAEWKQGVDSGGDDREAKMAINNAARRLGWKTEHPYKSGLEGHHWCFAERPRPLGLVQRARILHLRATLPRR